VTVFVIAYPEGYTDGDPMTLVPHWVVDTEKEAVEECSGDDLLVTEMGFPPEGSFNKSNLFVSTTGELLIPFRV